MSVTEKDYNEFYDLILNTTIKPNFNYGPWIAGGAALNLFAGDSIKNVADFDIFMKNDTQREFVTHRINERALEYGMVGVNVLHRSSNAVTYGVHHLKKNIQLKFQLIIRRYYDTLDDVFNDFDFTVCQFATDGKKFIHTPKALEAFNTKTLTVNRKHELLPRRVMKYMIYGYTPTQETTKMLNSDSFVWDYSEIMNSGDEYDF